MRYLVTGRAWKHHVSEDFTEGGSPLSPNGAGAGATVFLDFGVMKKYLKEDGRDWHIAELDLVNEELIFNMGSDSIATTVNPILSKVGFRPFAETGHSMASLMCFVIGNEEYGSYFDGQIFMSRAVFTDYRPHAKEYYNIDEAKAALETVRKASDMPVSTIGQVIKYEKII